MTTNLFANSACDRTGLLDEAALLDGTLEVVRKVVRKIEGQTGSRVLPRRRVVGRSFARMTRWGRLVRDGAARVDVAAAMAEVATASLLIRRTGQ